MAKTRCPFGMMIGVDRYSHDDCIECRGCCKEADRICQALSDAQGEFTMEFTGTSLIHFARICLNLDFETFARVTYGDHNLSERLQYLKGKYKIWSDNPMRLICQLDFGNLRTLSAYINGRLEEGDS